MSEVEDNQATRDRFAELLTAAIRRAGEQRKIEYNAEQFQLQIAEGGFINLSNVFRAWVETPEEGREKVISHTVRSWCSHRFELPEAFEDARPDLLPTVRARAYYEFATLQAKASGSKEGPDVPQQIIGEHLSASIVYDLPSAMRSLTARELQAWGVTFYEALEAATDNLREMTKGVMSPAEGVYLSMTGDNYDPSRLLLPDMWRQLEFQGDPVAVIPNRDVLLVTGSENDTGLEVLAALAEEGLKQARPISGRLLRLEGDTWEDWLPPPDHPQAIVFGNLARKTAWQDYSEQRTLLQPCLAAQHNDAFVAGYSALSRKESSEIMTYSIWSRGQRTWLPESDIIVLFEPGPDQTSGRVVASGSLERVQEIAGPLLSRVEIYPARWETSGFPDAHQLAAIGKDDRLPM